MSQPTAHSSDPGDEENDVYEFALEEADLPYLSDWLREGGELGEDENDSDYEDEEVDDDDDQFHDAEEGEVEVELTIEEEAEDDNAEHAGIAEMLTWIAGRGAAGRLTQRQLFLLLRGRNLSQDDEDFFQYHHRRRTRPDPNRFPVVPSDEGRTLMNSGVFGSTEQASSVACGSQQQTKKALAWRLLEREMGLGNWGHRQRNQAMMAQSLIPTTDPEMIIRFDAPVYSGQFSDDGNFFFCCVQDFKVRLYDTSNPYDWRHYKTLDFPFGRWTMTDGSLSPDNRWLAYTSITPKVCLAPTDPNDSGDPYTLDLSGLEAGAEARPASAWRRNGDFGIWSIRFSGDGRELVAGTNAASVIVFDIESRQVLHVVKGHDDDVNAVCFADKTSPHLLYSGSDDATIKVWDRRSMGDGREAGAFVGHCEGLTYLDSKGDGRYILSNGKDQCMKLWDLRMAMSTAAFRERRPTRHTRHSEYDYRWGQYDDNTWFRHPDDNSLVTFRGHKVQRTLIRCHFSPPGSTDSRYVYSGSHDGQVYVWNLDATLAARINVREATACMLPPRFRYHSAWTTCVREASWHPTAPLLVASSWNGPNMDFGSCTLHSWNDSSEDEAEPIMGRQVNEKLEP